MGIFIAIRKDTYFLLVFVLFAVHSTFDPQLTWIGYNCFLMAYSYIHDGQAGEKSSGNEKTKYSCQSFLFLKTKKYQLECNKVVQAMLQKIPKEAISVR